MEERGREGQELGGARCKQVVRDGLGAGGGWTQVSQVSGSGAGNWCSGRRHQRVQRPWSWAVGDVQETIFVRVNIYQGFTVSGHPLMILTVPCLILTDTPDSPQDCPVPMWR